MSTIVTTRHFAAPGYEEIAAAAQRLRLDRRRDEAAALIPDDMVLKTNRIGTDAMVRDRIRAYRDAGVTTLRADPDARR